MDFQDVSRLDLIGSRHSEAIELFKSNVNKFNTFKHLNSSTSIQVLSINEGDESFNSLEDLVAKKEDGISNLWENWNVAHRKVLTSLKEKDTVMQKIVKEKDALADLKFRIQEEKIAQKDLELQKMQEKIALKDQELKMMQEKLSQKVIKQKDSDSEPKCSTPIKGFRNLDLRKRTPASNKSKIIGMKNTKEKIVIPGIASKREKSYVVTKGENNDLTIQVQRRNNLTLAFNKRSFQVDEEDFGIMENKPIFQLHEESIMEDDFDGHINDAFEDDQVGFEDEPVYENIRPGRLSSISSIPPRNMDTSSIPPRNMDISSNPPRYSDTENEVFSCRMEPKCKFSGSKIENHIATVHREHLAEIMNMASGNKITI